MRFCELTESQRHSHQAPAPGARVGRVLGTAWRSEAASGYRFILLPFLLLALIKIYPFVYNFVLSVTDETLAFVGIAQFERILGTQTTVNALRNTVYLTALVVPIGTLLSLFAAIAVNERFRFRPVIRLGFVLPMVTSIVVGSMVWELILLPRGGLLNSVLGTEGVNWLQTPNLAMPAVAAVIIWSAVGLNMLVFLAALQDIDRDLIGAAIVDGATYVQRIWYVILPSIKNVMLFVVATLTIMVFRSFGVIFVLTQGGPVQRTNTLVWEAYLSAFSYLRFNEAAAMAVLMVVVILLITAAYFRALRSNDR
jgi:multiple sugar transport system permease protein